MGVPSRGPRAPPLDSPLVSSTANMDDHGQFFVFPFEIERRHCIFSLITRLELLVYGTDLDNREFRL